MNREALLSAVDESVTLKRAFFAEHADTILQAGSVLSEALAAGHKVLAFGNGGSAADSQHLSSELVNRFVGERRALPAIALSTDTSILTSIANDRHYDEVFSRQIEALGAAGDVAVAISTSGNSPNVLRAVETSRRMQMKTLGLAGRDGGKLASAVDVCLTVPHRETARVQEVHGMLIHFLCQMVEDALFS